MNGLFFVLIWAMLSGMLMGGCMAMGMPGMGHRGEGAGSESVVVRHSAGDVKAVLEIPPLAVERSAVLSLRLSRATDGLPITGAQVTMKIVYLNRAAVSMAGHEHHLSADRMQSLSEFGAGVYQLSHTFVKPGRYQVTAKVQLDGEEEGEPLVLSASQEIASRHSYMGHAGRVPKDVLGIGAMILMMSLVMGGSWLF